MSFPYGAIIVDTSGFSSVVVTFTQNPTGVTPTVYVDPLGVTPITLPDTITARKKYFMGNGDYTVSCQVSGTEMSGAVVGVSSYKYPTVSIGPNQPEIFGTAIGTSMPGNTPQGTVGGLTSFNTRTGPAITLLKADVTSTGLDAADVEADVSGAAATVQTNLTAETARAEAAEALLLPLAGGTMSGTIDMNSHKLLRVQAGTINTNGAQYAQTFPLTSFFGPFTPTGQATITQTMAGLGVGAGGVLFTPILTGKLWIVISGYVGVSGTIEACNMIGRYSIAARTDTGITFSTSTISDSAILVADNGRVITAVVGTSSNVVGSFVTAASAGTSFTLYSNALGSGGSAVTPNGTLTSITLGAPGNGAPIQGTTFTQGQVQVRSGVVSATPNASFALIGTPLSLTVNTQYWIDFSEATTNISGTTNFGQIMVVVQEVT